MLKPYHALLLLPLAIAACSSDDDDDGPNTPDTGANALTSEGTYMVTFTNTSDSQPMTPPVVAIHDDTVRVFEVGQTVTNEVRAIAEDGEIQPLVVNLTQNSPGVVDVQTAFADPAEPGPLLPGASATVSVTSDAADQMLSVVTMVVCTNDGFTGFDSRALSDVTETVMAPIYDAGSELNQLETDHWVEPCGSAENLHDDEGGVIAAHPGQVGSETPVHDFAPGTEYLQMQITRN